MKATAELVNRRTVDICLRWGLWTERSLPRALVTGITCFAALPELPLFVAAPFLFLFVEDRCVIRSKFLWRSTSRSRAPNEALGQMTPKPPITAWPSSITMMMTMRRPNNPSSLMPIVFSKLNGDSKKEPILCARGNVHCGAISGPTSASISPKKSDTILDSNHSHFVAGVRAIVWGELKRTSNMQATQIRKYKTPN